MKTPMPFQDLAINYMAQHNTYLCDECGLGKTLMAIEAVKAAGYAQGKVLVICQKSARGQWRDTILEQIPNAQVILTEHIPYKFQEINAWFITTYDELVPKSILYPVARVVWNSIIIDEAHKLRNATTARSKNITKLIGAQKIALSATPIEQHGGQLWPILKWLDRETFPAYWAWVTRTFEVSKGYFGGFNIGDPIDLVSYQAEVMPYVIRRSKVEVAPDLPEKIEAVIPVLMEGAQVEAYNTLYESIDALVDIQDKQLLITNALTLFTRLHQIAVLPALLGLKAPSAKIEWLADWLDNNPYHRVLVFSKYRDVIAHVHNMCGAFRVMKGIDESQRFKDGEGRILAGTIDSMSESLSLGMADAAIFLDQHWSSTKMQQAVDRIHRIDITSPKLIYYLDAADVDTRVMKAVTGKMTEQEMLLEFVHAAH